ncbi:MAG: tRNA (adenosine(37)-N6)-dimethylallyltransferase MiaA [Candidatus Abawacabacteria bacterium]|nr:tRNA (adenosine(37)-N6)-dimethylallyltransferase MiaA [Candidatus Abawacabacteria bacterium]
MGTSWRESIVEQASQYIETQLKKEPQSLLVLLGPTASGKTSLACELAKKFPLEIVSADSRLVYRGMDIGTAKPQAAELQQVPHHLIDIVSPEDNFTLADYLPKANEAIEKVFANTHVPLLVGGTMLYIDGLVYNYQLPGSEGKKVANYRNWPLVQLQDRLMTLNPQAQHIIDWQNSVRLMRVLEYYDQTGAWLWQQKKRGTSKYPYLLLGLAIDKKLLRARIAARVEKQLADGLIKEVQRLQKTCPIIPNALTGIGYRQVIRYLNGEYSLQAMKDQVIRDTCAYAKRQMTWWKRNKEIIWLSVTD